MAEWWEAAPLADDQEWWKKAPLRQAGPTGADAMRARGLSSPDPAYANAQADPRGPVRKAADVGLNYSAGATKGLTGLLGMPSDLAEMGINAVTGGDVDLPLGGDEIQQAMLPNNHPPVARNAMERRAGVLGEYTGTGMIGGLPGLASSAAAGLAAGEVRERDGGPIAEIAAALVAGGVPAMVGGAVSKAAQTKRAIAAVPDIDDLKASSGALYEKGTATGKTAARGYTKQLQGIVRGIAKDQGLISPTGRMSTSYPKVSEALKMIDDYAGQKMSPEQMRQVRRVLQDAAQSADGAEARIGTQMLKKFDDFVEPLVPEFREADKIYARAKRGEEVKEAIDIAQKGRRTAPETALSNEFQNLVRKGIRGDMTFPPELEAAVGKVANAGLGRQAAATAGKAAPTGIVSGGIGFGVPAALATPFLGPIGGLAVGGAASGGGAIARLLANRMAQGDARKALATALNGAEIPKSMTPDEVKQALVSLLMSTAAAQ